MLTVTRKQAGGGTRDLPNHLPVAGLRHVARCRRVARVFPSCHRVLPLPGHPCLGGSDGACQYRVCRRDRVLGHRLPRPAARVPRDIRHRARHRIEHSGPPRV